MRSASRHCKDIVDHRGVYRSRVSTKEEFTDRSSPVDTVDRRGLHQSTESTGQEFTGRHALQYRRKGATPRFILEEKIWHGTLILTGVLDILQRVDVAELRVRIVL